MPAPKSSKKDNNESKEKKIPFRKEKGNLLIIAEKGYINRFSEGVKKSSEKLERVP